MERTDPLHLVVAHVETGRASADERGARIVPDGHVDILWTPGAPPFLAGPDTGPTVAVIGRRAPYVRVQLHRGRAGALTRIGVDETTDQRIPLDAVWRDARWRDLSDEDDIHRGRSTLLDTLRDRLDKRWQPDQAVEQLLRGIDPGIGERQRRRRFRRAIGYGQATLRRIDRFSLVRDLCTRGGHDLASAAAVAGYSDQAHLTREVRRLSGLTPTAYFG